jgi:hypothetical protein
LNVLSARSELTTGLTGGGLATGPAIANKIRDVPFYESEWWLGVIAILGATLLIVSLANGITRFIRDRWDK